MSENTIETTTEAGAELEQPTEAESTEQEQDGGNAEAAKYRRRLREAEAQRDTLTERLEGLQRAEVERLAGEHLAKGAGIWTTTALSDVLDDDGTVDPAKVTQAAQEARESVGLAPAHGTPRPDPSQGALGQLGGQQATFESAFGPHD